MNVVTAVVALLAVRNARRKILYLTMIGAAALLAVLVVAAVGLRTPDSRQTEER